MLWSAEPTYVTRFGTDNSFRVVTSSNLCLNSSTANFIFQNWSLEFPYCLVGFCKMVVGWGQHLQCVSDASSFLFHSLLGGWQRHQGTGSGVEKAILSVCQLGYHPTVSLPPKSHLSLIDGFGDWPTGVMVTLSNLSFAHWTQLLPYSVTSSVLRFRRQIGMASSLAVTLQSGSLASSGVGLSLCSSCVVWGWYLRSWWFPCHHLSGAVLWSHSQRR